MQNGVLRYWNSNVVMFYLKAGLFFLCDSNIIILSMKTQCCCAQYPSGIKNQKLKIKNSAFCILNSTFFLGRIALAGLAQCRFTESEAWRQGQPSANDYAVGMPGAYSFVISNIASISHANGECYLMGRFLQIVIYNL